MDTTVPTFGGRPAQKTEIKKETKDEEEEEMPDLNDPDVQQSAMLIQKAYLKKKNKQKDGNESKSKKEDNSKKKDETVQKLKVKGGHDSPTFGGRPLSQKGDQK